MLTVFLIQMLKTHSLIDKFKFSKIEIENSYAQEKIEASVNNNRDTENLNFELVNADKETLPINTLSLARGVYQFKKLKVYTTGHFKLFYCWRFIKINKKLYIYPQKDSFKLEDILNRSNMKDNQDEDFKEHILYTNDLPSSRINWKIYAKNNALLWKKFESDSLEIKHLDLNLVKGDFELKIKKISYLVHHYHKYKISWSLEINGIYLQSSFGHEHFINSLKLLSEASQ